MPSRNTPSSHAAVRKPTDAQQPKTTKKHSHPSSVSKTPAHNEMAANRPAANKVPSVNPPDATQLAPDLMTTPILHAENLAINTRLCLFICTVCQCALTAKTVHAHLSKTHKRTPTSTVSREIHSHNILPEYPENLWDKTPCQPFGGLAITKKQCGCPLCPFASKRRGVMKHIRDQHKGTDANPDEGLCTQALHHTFPRCITGFDSGAHQPTTGIPNARMIAPWLLRNGWHRELEPHKEHVAELRELVSMPKGSEFPWLQKLVQAYFTQATELMDATDTLVLQRLNSSDTDKQGINNTPLHEHQQETTLGQYILPLVHLVAALLRVTPNYKFSSSPAVDQALVLLKAQRTEDSLHRLFCALWQAEWVRSKTKLWPDPTMSFLCFFQLKQDGGFKGPKETTRPIAQLCWAIRLSALTQIHHWVDAGVCATQCEAMDRLARFVKDKANTTFGTLMTLQHYASALAYKSMSAPQIWWLDSEHWSSLKYLGDTVSMSNLREIAGGIEKEMLEIWEKKILLGTGLYVQYDDLADDLTNKTTGYSFLSDERNPFAQHKHTLATRIFQDPELRKKFTVQIPGVKGDQLNMRAVREWLIDLAEFEGLSIAANDEEDGGPTRGTELSAMLACNTELRSRNLTGLGKHVATIHPKRPPHPLGMGSFLGDLTVQLHTFARPLAQYFASVVWPENPEIAAQYNHMLFMDFGKEFTTAKVGEFMVKTSIHILHWKMTVRPYRHINIAFRRKWCKAATDLLEPDGFSIVNALQGGHTYDTENMGYGLSKEDVLTGMPEDVLLAYLDASSAWQRALKVVPGGLGLTYMQAYHANYDRLLKEGVFKPHNAAQTELEKQSKMLHEMFAMTKQLLGTVHDLRADVDSLSPDMDVDSDAREPELAQSTEAASLPEQRPVEERQLELSPVFETLDMDVDAAPRVDKGKGRAVEPDDTPEPESPIFGLESLPLSHGEEFDRALESSYGDSGVSQASILEMIQSGTHFSSSFCAVFSDAPSRSNAGTSPTDSSFDLFDYPPDTSFDASFDFESTDQKEVIEISDDEEDVKPIIHASTSTSFSRLFVALKRPAQRKAGSSKRPRRKHRHESSAPAASSSKSGLFDRPTAAASSKHAGVAPEPKGSAGVPPPVASSSKGQALPHNTHDLLQCLKRLYGPTAHWKSVEQLAAVKALLSLETDVIIRLPTGAGKTAAAVLPTMVEHGVTVIILPLIALIEDWERRLKGLGIRYERFAGRGNIELKGDSNIILVTSDMAKRPAWKTAISALNERRPVLRTIVDEAQYYAMDYNFREDALDNAFQLRILPHQIALMSATIPDAMEKYLVDQFELTNYQCISASIHRPELQLVIEDLGQDRCDLLSTVRRIIAEETSSDSFLASSKNRFIIYVTTIEDGEYLKKELGLPFYHAHSTQHPISDHDRQHIYGGWVDGVYIGFIATNSMGAGNDYQSLTLEEQQAGRAGRDGQHATNYLVCMGGGWRPSKSTEHPKYGDIPGRQALYDLIHKTHPNHPQSCYQHQITGFFDGEGNARTCAELGRERVCQPCAAGMSPSFLDNIHRLKSLPRRPSTVSNRFDRSRSIRLAFWSARPEAGLKRKLAEAFGDSTLNANKRTGALIVANPTDSPCLNGCLTLSERRVAIASRAGCPTRESSTSDLPQHEQRTTSRVLGGIQKNELFTRYPERTLLQVPYLLLWARFTAPRVRQGKGHVRPPPSGAWTRIWNLDDSGTMFLILENT
ncbi:hypothetical protein K438DRAFT_1790273 [Mycena galopus ATCC 62051]|nr:hypothetical protein K438DRAFT_1790273 [Mycena galopus ATCC 62051]